MIWKAGCVWFLNCYASRLKMIYKILPLVIELRVICYTLDFGNKPWSMGELHPHSFWGWPFKNTLSSCEAFPPHYHSPAFGFVCHMFGWLWAADMEVFLSCSFLRKEDAGFPAILLLPKSLFSEGFWMESCREKIVGRKQVANLIKTARLFELRCLTAYECALISLQPVNPIHIMFCLKRDCSAPLW